MPLDGDAAGTFGRVPTDLRAWHQWVCWKYGTGPTGKPTKLPIQARSGELASVTDPATWDTFEAVVAAAGSELWGAHGIGFVFGPDDPYAGIDLDVGEDGGTKELREAHDAILAAFPSYTEVSPSRRGLHVIVRGSIQGARRHGVEAYSNGRFFTMTGQVSRDLPIITPLKEALAELQEAPAPGRTALSFLSTVPETEPDHVIVERMRSAANGPKAMRLAAGDLSALDGRDRSGSALDLALVNCIAFHTQCVPQIERIWLRSEHGQNPLRLKKLARIDYRMATIRRALDRAVPAVDFTALQAEWAAQRALKAASADASKEAPMNATDADDLLGFAAGRDPHEPPPGLMGTLAQFIYNAAHRQVREIALAGAVGWMAGVCGASYNVNGDGLNLYIAMLAESGAGKSAVKNAYGIIRNALDAAIPAFAGFYGPGDFASGPGLLRVLGTQRAFVSLIGEFGVWLEEMGGNRPNPARQSLRRALLDLYLASGANGSYEGTANAKLENSVSIIKQPAVTIIGETTPDVFYDAMNDNNIQDGFLARFVIFEYAGDMPFGNYAKINVVPDLLLNDIKQLVSFSLMCNHQAVPCQVIVPPAIMERMKALDAFCVGRVRASASKSVKAVWGRVVANVWKIASLVAIGINYHSPVLDDAALNWSIAYVAHSVNKLVAKLESGEVAGSLSEKQYAELMRVLREFPAMPADSLDSYRLKPANLTLGIVNATFLNRRLRSLPTFRASGFHVDAALKAAISRATEEDVLRIIPKDDPLLKTNFLSGTCYAINQFAI